MYFYVRKFCWWIASKCRGDKATGKATNINKNAASVGAAPVQQQTPQDREMEYRKLKRKIAKAQANATVRVPIIVSLSVILFYIMLGSYIFTNAEGSDWTYLVGCYFCFVTISTIGFGDFVFGQDVVALTGNETIWESIWKQRKLFGTCIYILVGLSINSMCIDLVAFEIMSKVHNLAVRLGFVKEDEDSDVEQG